MLPDKIIFTGTPGSGYDTIAQILENLDGFENVCELNKIQQPEELFSDSKKDFIQDCIICVYRKDSPSLQSWLEAGEQNLTKEEMKAIIKNNNKHILSFVMKHYLKLEKFTPYWIERTFGKTVDFDCSQFQDIFVAIYQPELSNQVEQS